MAGVNIDGIAVALASKFAGGLGLPTGITGDIAVATANPPNAVPETPAVIVFADSGRLVGGNQLRHGVHRFRVQFLLRLGVDVSRDEVELRQWLGDGTSDAGLLYRLHPGAAIQLGGLVSRCAIIDWRIGVIVYNRDEYSGIDMTVEAVTDDPWTPS